MRYIGSKKALLLEIKDMVDKHTTGQEEIFLDLFAGTNVVANYFKQYYTVYSNDILFFSYANAKAIIENNSIPQFSKLIESGIKHPMKYLQDLVNNDTVGYYEKAYSPSGNANYLSIINAKKIDAIRATIDEWQAEKLITEYEYFYLLSSLIESIPFVSNITGTYGAFLKHWDKRALNELQLKDLMIFDNSKQNKAFNEDANTLIKKIKADIVYIDTPYNSRQYASNYHLLENVARNEHPELKGVTKIFDWKHLKSDYATKRNALQSMDDLIKNVDATHIILSYNNEGIISEEELTLILKKYAIDGMVDIKKIPYRKYNSKIAPKTNDLYELLFYIQRKPITERVLNNNIKKHEVKVQSSKKYIKSPLNYIGGKYKLLNQLLPLFPDNIDTFVDLFSGGANVGINVEAKKHIFNDMNCRINEMFRFFQTQSPVELVQNIENRIKEWGLSKTNEDAFLTFRKYYNNHPNPLDLYILSSYSYNYQFRFNNSMEFNNPFGRNRSQFSENMKMNLLNFISKLQTLDAVFTDYFLEEFDFSELNTNDFVYLDPPYLITTGSYNDGKRGFSDWGEQQELEMYRVMKDLTKRNIKFALSNVLVHKGKTNTLLEKFIKEENLIVHELNYNYKNASYNTNKGDSLEVLVTNYKKG